MGEKITEKQLRKFLFGWLWVEDNIMKDVRESVKEAEQKKIAELIER